MCSTCVCFIVGFGPFQLNLAAFYSVITDVWFSSNSIISVIRDEWRDDFQNGSHKLEEISIFRGWIFIFELALRSVTTWVGDMEIVWRLAHRNILVYVKIVRAEVQYSALYRSQLYSSLSYNFMTSTCSVKVDLMFNNCSRFSLKMSSWKILLASWKKNK